MKILLDVFGCDNPPEIILEGAVDALNQYGDLSLIFTGDKEILLPVLKKLNADMSRVEIIDAKEVIYNEDSPTAAMKLKPDSSLVKGIEAINSREDIAGMISCGSTGAVLTIATLKIGRIKGVQRAALCALLPTEDGKQVCIADCGANPDCKSDYYVQFAHMGNSYIKAVYGIESPRIALVSVGVEDNKGSVISKEVFTMLQKQDINFVGNMEARESLSGKYDLLVCDGFTGNVLLKAIEGTASMMMKVLKTSIMASTSAKIGSLFMKKAFRSMKKTMDYHAMGGAPLLGIKKILVKCHGSSNATAILAGIRQVMAMSKGRMIENIEKGIESIIV